MARVVVEGGQEYRGYIVVGADGIRSAVRRALLRKHGLDKDNTIQFSGRVHFSGYTEPLDNCRPQEIGVANWMLYDQAIMTIWPCQDNRQWYIGVKKVEGDVDKNRSVWSSITPEDIKKIYGRAFHPFAGGQQFGNSKPTDCIFRLTRGVGADMPQSWTNQSASSPATCSRRWNSHPCTMKSRSSRRRRSQHDELFRARRLPGHRGRGRAGQPASRAPGQARPRLRATPLSLRAGSGATDAGLVALQRQVCHGIHGADDARAGAVCALAALHAGAGLGLDPLPELALGLPTRGDGAEPAVGPRTEGRLSNTWSWRLRRRQNWAARGMSSGTASEEIGPRGARSMKDARTVGNERKKDGGGVMGEFQHLPRERRRLEGSREGQMGGLRDTQPGRDKTEIKSQTKEPYNERRIGFCCSRARFDTSKACSRGRGVSHT